MEILIFESNLGKRNTYVAIKRYIERKSMIEIAGELSDMYGREISRNTISDWLSEISERMLDVHKKISL